MLAELRITPIDKEVSFVDTVAAIVSVIAGGPLSYQVHGMSTALEGDLDVILDTVRHCHEAVRERSSRTLIELSIDDRDTPPGELKRSLEHLRAAPLSVPLERSG